MKLRTNQNKYKVDYLYYNAFFYSSDFFFFYHPKFQDFTPILYFVLTHTAISKNLVTTTGPHNLSL